ncbi:MAG: hypothetical protein A2029_16110 [Chloroflexi bacterium RBG_19FT_COMBO_47_9]|nr:MAG: hypothetical protein A2029_16110 [Chloroflexi bacterium RBG_19FT_COMBO_47_9]
MKIRQWIRPLSPERRIEVLKELEQASSPGFDFFLMVVLSCSIATFGLLINSAAVIIGAMLVAPLMSPILGLSLASIAGERRMFQHALLALIEGILLAIVLSSILGWVAKILPFDMLIELPQEILARTRPTPFDLGIALAGGAAAAYALAQPRLSAALPGVAIATALMPPLCTIGIGISLGDSNVVFGAGLLFFTNLAAISFAGILVFLALGFRPVHLENTWHRIPRSLIFSAGMVLITAIPLVILTLRIVGQAHKLQEVRTTVAAEISALPDAQLVDVSIDSSDSTLNLVITVRTSRQPSYHQVVNLQKAIAALTADNCNPADHHTNHEIGSACTTDYYTDIHSNTYSNSRPKSHPHHNSDSNANNDTYSCCDQYFKSYIDPNEFTNTNIHTYTSFSLYFHTRRIRHKSEGVPGGNYHYLFT